MCPFGMESFTWNIIGGPIPPRRGTNVTTASWKTPWVSWNGCRCFPAWPGGAYPAQRIHDCWETVLRDQFHDIIPGSSIHEVYEDTRKEYEALWREVDAMEKEAFEALCEDGDGSGHGSYSHGSSRNNGNYSHNSYSLLRFADTDCGEAVLIPESRDGSFTDEEGKCLSAQKVSDGWLVEAGVKPLGLTEVHFTEEKQPETDSPLCPGFGRPLPGYPFLQY